MEAIRKRGGLLKGKLMSFHRSAAAKPPYSTVQYTSKVIKPSQSSPSAASVEFMRQPKQKVSYVVPADSSHYENLYGVAADDAIDMKAGIFISSVQERFKLERVNSERVNKCQDVQ